MVFEGKVLKIRQIGEVHWSLRTPCPEFVKAYFGLNDDLPQNSVSKSLKMSMWKTCS
jgi:hypothetical protein